jgi:hypothetical protein
LPIKYFLHTAAMPPIAGEFDRRIEAWRQKTLLRGN